MWHPSSPSHYHSRGSDFQHLFLGLLMSCPTSRLCSCRSILHTEARSIPLKCKQSHILLSLQWLPLPVLIVSAPSQGHSQFDPNHLFSLISFHFHLRNLYFLYMGLFCCSLSMPCGFPHCSRCSVLCPTFPISHAVPLHLLLTLLSSQFGVISLGPESNFAPVPSPDHRLLGDRAMPYSPLIFHHSGWYFYLESSQYMQNWINLCCLLLLANNIVTGNKSFVSVSYWRSHQA